MSKTKKDKKRDAKALAASTGITLDEVDLDAPAVGKRDDGIMWAPVGVDPRSMPITQIVWVPEMLDDFDSLEGDHRKAAYDFLFGIYKSRGRDKERNRLLHNEVGLFISRTKAARKTGVEHVKGKVKAGKKERDLLAVLKGLGIESADDLTALLGGGE